MTVLDRPVLALNRLWQPVGVVSVSKAMTKVWNENARIIDPNDFAMYDWEDWSELRPEEGELVIKTKTSSFKVPEVIVLKNYDKLPSNAVTFSRRNIFKRDKFTCNYCGKQPGSEELTLDHILPRSQGGQSTWTNCTLSCIKCNAYKADRTPEQAKMKLRHEPHRPNWKPLYAAHRTRIKSWEKFVSEVYWSIELDS